MPNPLTRFRSSFNHLVSTLERAFLQLTQPTHDSIAHSIVANLPRSKSQLIAENALVRQQLIILHRQVKKPRITQSDRLWLVLVGSCVQQGKDTLLILKHNTLLRWHRLGFRLFWKFKSRNRGGRLRLSTDTIALIQQIAKYNLHWGAQRIHGKILKLDITLATVTIQKYVRMPRRPKTLSQTWSVFLNNHGKHVSAFDFLPVIDVFFRQTYLFLIVELASRRIVHFVTAHPTDAWVAQQLREATPYGQTPRLLIRDRDSKYGEAFTRVAKGSLIEVLKTPNRAPKANAICERYLGSIRRECLDHILILAFHLGRTVKVLSDPWQPDREQSFQAHGPRTAAGCPDGAENRKHRRAVGEAARGMTVGWRKTQGLIEFANGVFAMVATDPTHFVEQNRFSV